MPTIIIVWQYKDLWASIFILNQAGRIFPAGCIGLVIWSMIMGSIPVRSPSLKKLAYYDSVYFKKIEGINSSLKNLIRLIKSKTIDKSIAVKLAGLVKRLENYTDSYSGNPDQEKAKIQEDFDEKISLVQKIIPFLTKMASGRGSVRIN